MSDTTQATPSTATDPVDIEADIAQHRAELADTIDQLSAKLDVKSRVREQTVRTKEKASRKVQSLRERATSDAVDSRRVGVVAGVGAIIGFAATGIAIRRRRNRR